MNLKLTALIQFLIRYEKTFEIYDNNSHRSYLPGNVELSFKLDLKKESDPIIFRYDRMRFSKKKDELHLTIEGGSSSDIVITKEKLSNLSEDRLVGEGGTKSAIIRFYDKDEVIEIDCSLRFPIPIMGGCINLRISEPVVARKE